MNDTLENFKNFVFAPEALFSADNPLLQSTGKAHRGFFEAFDSAARANLSLASDLLDLNRKRLDALYSGKPLSDQLQTQADILFESGQRLVAWTDELRESANAYRTSVTDLANEAAAQAAPAKKAARKTAKAA